ncbi:butyrate kinase [Petrimonas sulfuriphila]|uniref:butyrate kinase n=1 Tax=Petrimonas sulfuriphila TaxID=285070 RepID=UPI003255C1D5
MDNHPRILVINPGSTSTKIAVYKNGDVVFLKTIRHSVEELSQFKRISDQYEFRKNIVYNELKNAEIRLDLIRIVVGRGGIVKPIASGVYRVNETMKRDLIEAKRGEHASNLGALIADDIAKQLPSAEAFIADPVVVDEFEPIARYSGHPLFERVSLFHALNQKAIARAHAKSLMRRYEDMDLIVVHLGGGISVGVHHQGRVVDVNQALDGDGPISPERSGTLPVGELLKMAFSGKYTYEEMKSMVVGKGGLYAYTGLNNAYEVEKAAQAGDKKCYDVMEAMAYQTAKEIGAFSTVLKGDVDAILITGGMANSKWFCNLIIERIHKIAPVYVYPGEDEMKALAENGALILSGEIEPKEYV